MTLDELAQILEDAAKVVRKADTRLREFSTKGDDRKINTLPGYLGLSQRAKNVLYDYGDINTVSDLTSMTRDKFSNRRNAGEVTVAEIEKWLEDNNISFRY